jgi:hypothetical protein
MACITAFVLSWFGAVQQKVFLCLMAKKQTESVYEDKRGHGTGASDTPSVRIQNLQGTIPYHGGECVQIFCSPSTLEQS